MKLFIATAFAATLSFSAVASRASRPSPGVWPAFCRWERQEPAQNHRVGRRGGCA